MKIKNEAKQIKEVIKRLNYYEKGLQSGNKIEHEGCNLCHYTQRCRNCIINTGNMCIAGNHARVSVSSFSHITRFDSKVIRKWQKELKRRANKRLKDSGSKWRIAWERVK